MKKTYFLFLLFLFSCTEGPQENVSKIPAPGQTEKRQVYFFLKEKRVDCFSDFWPESEAFSRLNSRWSVSVEYVDDAETLKAALLEKNARNPELLIVGPGFRKSGLKLPHNGISQVFWMDSEVAANDFFSFAWKDLDSLNAALCLALPDSKKCINSFSTCPGMGASRVAEPGLDLLLSGRFSSTPFVRVMVDWPKVFDELVLSGGRTPVVVGVSNTLLKLKILGEDHPHRESLENAFKLWTLKKLGGGLQN